MAMGGCAWDGLAPSAFSADRNSSMRSRSFRVRQSVEDHEFDHYAGGNCASARPARHASIGAQDFRHRLRHGGAGLFAGRRTCAGSRSRLSVRSRHHARDPRRLRLQPPRDDHRLSRHRQVDPYRAGRRAPQLAAASASISTATSPASISSARTRSCCTTASR